jgi:hypothetical protein
MRGLTQTQPALPWSGTCPQSRHASWLGAKDAAHRSESQVAKYLALLEQHPEGLTDAEAADLMRIDRSSINARRRALVHLELVVADGFRKSKHGIRNVVWKKR